ncbi:hypothetical protein L228DRAFT_239748 [Xylona heveae TC161]|uniref:Sulfhydryl oxidase n=1 Tax=Xylona heveae (strain CBS 132557 / TC161) TaxID=1328760 RepID=A0A165G6U5_XYLHT|nr:hypothetical protein L228DRAFT_239748 [Xylona heveae TC161]KZF21806.1 hypothetical protein L228DRAFT_239748 [Xylona heveae TC161]
MAEILAEQVEELERRKQERLQQGGDQNQDPATQAQSQKLPKGMVIGKDGKPCRSCTSVADWMALSRRKIATDSPSSSSSSTTTSSSSAFPSAAFSSTSSTPVSSTTSKPATTSPSPAQSFLEGPLRDDCPADVEALGRSSWTLLHTISASYPEKANTTEQSEMKQFLSLFGKFYPCWICASDFQSWMTKKGNEPRVEGREGLGKWMCEAHNEVNRKLGKKEFDCTLWKERWRDGWKDGSCD